MATEKYLYFIETESVNGYLSQLYKCSFKDESYIYSSAEQYMMVQKAILFRDSEICKKILAASTPAAMKKLGRQVKKFDEEIWVAHREEIVYNGNLLKFDQNDDICDLLLATGDDIIAEASPYDKIWGIGVCAKLGLTRSDWKGLNLLGYTLMKVRDELTA